MIEVKMVPRIAEPLARSSAFPTSTCSPQINHRLSGGGCAKFVAETSLYAHDFSRCAFKFAALKKSQPDPEVFWFTSGLKQRPHASAVFFENAAHHQTFREQVRCYLYIASTLSKGFEALTLMVTAAPLLRSAASSLWGDFPRIEDRQLAIGTAPDLIARNEGEGGQFCPSEKTISYVSENMKNSSESAELEGALLKTAAAELIVDGVYGLLETIADSLHGMPDQEGRFLLSDRGRFTELVSKAILFRMPVAFYDSYEFLSVLHKDLTCAVSKGEPHGSSWHLGLNGNGSLEVVLNPGAHEETRKPPRQKSKTRRIGTLAAAG